MNTEQKERLARRLRKMKSIGVSYSHMARSVNVSSTAVMTFAKEYHPNVLGEQKLNELWKLTERFFPEPRRKGTPDETSHE